MVAQIGFEPITHGASNRRSTVGATEPFKIGTPGRNRTHYSLRSKRNVILLSPQRH